VGGFSTTITGRVVLRVDVVEKGLLVSLAEQVCEFVMPEARESADPLASIVGIDMEAEIPDDPAMARLFPDAYPDDPEAALDFRRFTQRSLQEAKLAHARTVLQALSKSGEKITLSSGDIPSWLGFLNDARLAIGTRIEITEDNHEQLADLPEDDPRHGMFHVYDWLTYLQESLVQLLLP
jgi:hypothetical protein